MATPSYPLTLPSSPEFEEFDMTLARRTSVGQSIFNGAEQRDEQPFALWFMSGLLPKLDVIEAREWQSFIVEMRGQVGTTQVPIPGYTGPSTGYAGSAGLVNGASQTGTDLITDGWSLSTSLFNKGDYITVNDELKMIMAAISSDGGGNATLAIEPALRFSPANNDPLEISVPYAVMRFPNDEMGWRLHHAMLSSVPFQMVEAF